MSHVHRTPRTQQITSHENLMNWENPRPKPNLRGAIGLPKPTHLHPLENELTHLNPPLKKKKKRKPEFYHTILGLDSWMSIESCAFGGYCSSHRLTRPRDCSSDITRPSISRYVSCLGHGGLRFGNRKTTMTLWVNHQKITCTWSIIIHFTELIAK